MSDDLETRVAMAIQAIDEFTDGKPTPWEKSSCPDVYIDFAKAAVAEMKKELLADGYEYLEVEKKYVLPNTSYLIEHDLSPNGCFDIAIYIQQADGSKVWKGNGFEIIDSHILNIYQLPETKEQNHD